MRLLNIIRRMALREKLPIREIARRTGLSRDGDVTLTANTTLCSSRKNLAAREVNGLACAETDLVGQLNRYTQLM